MNLIYQEAFLFFLNYIDSISKDLSLIAIRKEKLTLPHVHASFLSAFLEDMKKLFEKEQTLLELEGTFMIVGDLHGHILDLFRIFKTFQYPSEFKYLFLGDLIDRGEFSFETIFFILLLKYLYPTSVYIIRGNHEFDSICSECGFLSEVQALYPEDNIFDRFIDLFNCLPLAAVLQNNIFCVHGGICPELETVNQIKLIQRPLFNYDNSLIQGLVWSDPFGNIEKFMENPRNSGYLFGQIQVENFLKQNSLKMIIRAHQCIKNGIQYLFNSQIATVFSASNYCGKDFNQSGVLILHKDGKFQKLLFDCFEYLTRNMVMFDDNVLPDSLTTAILPSYRHLSEQKNNFSSQDNDQILMTRKHLKKQKFRHFLMFKH
jgi:protein phosphatase